MSKAAASLSLYATIARKLALGIASGLLREGDRLSCRRLAGHYQVSGETVRRAAALLEDSGVVRLESGRGTIILSRLMAYEFLCRPNEAVSVEGLREEIAVLVQERSRLDESIAHLTIRLLERTARETSGKRGYQEGDHGSV